MAMKSITKRWLFNNLGIILVILIIAEIVFGVGIRSYYYNGVSQVLDAHANTQIGLFNKMTEQTDSDFDAEVRNAVESFEDRNKMEMMAISPDGAVAITSSGFKPESYVQMPDYIQARQNENGKGEFYGTMPNGESIMALTVLMPKSTSEYTALRYVVSLEKINRQILVVVALLTLVGIAIIFFVVFSSSYFIKSIVIPVGEVGATARKIAGGDFNVRLKKKNDDEIGQLCDIINYMAGELSATEQMKNEFISSVSHELRTLLPQLRAGPKQFQATLPIPK